MGFFKELFEGLGKANCMLCGKEHGYSDFQYRINDIIKVYKGYNYHLYSSYSRKRLNDIYPEIKDILKYDGEDLSLLIDHVCNDCYDMWIERFKFCDTPYDYNKKKTYKDKSINILNDNIIKRTKKLIEEECFDYMSNIDVLQMILLQLSEELDIKMDEDEVEDAISKALNYGYNFDVDSIDICNIEKINKISMKQVKDKIIKFRIEYDKAMINKSKVKVYNVNYGKDFSHLKGDVFSIPCGSRKTVVVYDKVKFFTALWGYDMAYNVCYNGSKVSGVMVKTRK